MKNILRSAARRLPRPIKNSIKSFLGKKKSTRLGVIDVPLELSKRKSLKVKSDIKKVTTLPLFSYECEQELGSIFMKESHVFPDMQIIRNPYKKAPLTALVFFQTDVACKAGFVVHSEYEEDCISGEVSSFNTTHRLPVYGLYPDCENKVTVKLWKEDGSLLDEKEILIQTEALPSCLEGALRIEKRTEKTAYGLIFVSGKAIPLPYAFDSHGIIRYYLDFSTKGYGLIPLSGGRYILFDRKYLSPTYLLPYSSQIYDMDLWGRVHKVFYLPKGCHHDVCEKEPGGNLMLITNSLAKHVGDVVIEVDRNTGEIVDQLDFRYVLGMSYRDMTSWIHLNTVLFRKEENALFICARNLHSVCKVNWKTKKLIWILGDPRFWKDTIYESKVLRPVGEIQWFYQPHSPYWASEDQLAIFDNHWHLRRPLPYFDDDPNSYVKIFKIDEERRTASLEHSYKGVKSKITSNPRVVKEKNRMFSMEGYLEPEIDGYGGMIYEFNYETEQVLNQFAIRDKFYRTYELAPDYDSLSREMILDENYIAGFLKKPKYTETRVKIPEQSITEEVTADGKQSVYFEISEDVLYIGARDHNIRGVYFAGKNNNYFRDMSKPPQKEPKFRNIFYFAAFPLHMMNPDTYQIVIDYEGIRYHSEKYVQIENR